MQSQNFNSLTVQTCKPGNLFLASYMSSPNYLSPSVQLLPEGKENSSSCDQHTFYMATLM